MKDIIDKFRSSHKDFKYLDSKFDQFSNPYDLFEIWVENAIEHKELEVNAFVLSTVGDTGQSSSRVVYLKDIIENEFVFYTNYNSKKSKEISINSKVSMLFFWPKLSRQIRIQGTCVKLDEKYSDAYFESRPRSSKIGAWASNQSDVLKDVSELEDRIKIYQDKFKDHIPRPIHWGGYKVKPEYFEFWQGRPSRLHDRIIYTINDDSWDKHKQNP